VTSLVVLRAHASRASKPGIAGVFVIIIAGVFMISAADPR